MLASSPREQSSRSSIGQHRLHFDEHGLLTKRVFEPIGGGASRGDALGAHGRIYEHGPDGLIVSIRNIDQRGEVLVEKTGIAELQRSFDAQGRLVAAEWRNARGLPAVNADLFARVTIARDAAGNIRQLNFLDANGAPTLHRQGMAQSIWTYDERGNVVETNYLGADGQAVLRSDWGASRWRGRHNQHGNLIDQAYFDREGRPTLHRAFYTHPDPARPPYSRGFDLIFRGLELVSGAQRMHRYEDYVAALAERGEPLAPYESYVDVFRRGIPPHGGFAIGLERFMMRLLEVGNVREVTLFPRDLHRLAP